MGIDARMLVKTKEAVTEEQVRQWAYHLAERFGYRKFWIFRELIYGGQQHCLSIIDELQQDDGSTVKPEEGGTLVNVHLASRYYGCEGYERGDLPLIINVARFLEETIPGASIWYGGDSVCMEPFGAEVREQYWRHFVEVGSEPYERHFGKEEPPLCDFCQYPMMECGWGGGKTLFRCNGCGLEIYRDAATGEITERTGGARQ